jgi:hypothetical protein
MDYKKDVNQRSKEREILYSQTVKAGKRIYYLDVKCSKRNELYLSVTESKKIQKDGDENSPFSFEKHKIFLYQEDFGKFIDAFTNAVRYIYDHNDEYDVNPFVQIPLPDSTRANESSAELAPAMPSAAEGREKLSTRASESSAELAPAMPSAAEGRLKVSTRANESSADDIDETPDKESIPTDDNGSSDNLSGEIEINIEF